VPLGHRTCRPIRNRGKETTTVRTVLEVKPLGPQAQARPLSGAGAGALRGAGVVGKPPGCGQGWASKVERAPNATCSGGAKPLVSPGWSSCGSAGALPPPLRSLGPLARHLLGADAGVASSASRAVGSAPLGCRRGRCRMRPRASRARPGISWVPERAPSGVVALGLPGSLGIPGLTEGPPGLTLNLAT